MFFFKSLSELEPDLGSIVLYALYLVHVQFSEGTLQTQSIAPEHMLHESSHLWQEANTSHKLT